MSRENCLKVVQGLSAERMYQKWCDAQEHLMYYEKRIAELEAQLAQCQQVVKDFPQYRGSLLEKDELCQQIEDAEKRLLERKALLDLKNKRVEVLEAENERLKEELKQIYHNKIEIFNEGMERAAEIPVDIKSEIYGQDPSYKEGVRVGVCLKERAIRAELEKSDD